MHLYCEDVNDAFRWICKGFHQGVFPSRNQKFKGWIRSEKPPMSHSPSRYGEVIVVNEPVTITYSRPLKRVLFNPYRDCNPFFHLIEALWTLAGRDDIEPLMHFNSKVKDFSDDRKTWYGAYGKRWDMGCVPRRFGKGENMDIDRTDTQLKQAIDILKADRTSRRVVLQQWESGDLVRVIETPTCKDVPCNTEVMFLPRGNFLDMTVINRSNDMIWGALGSNYVTFSFLLEYIALAAGFTPGVYNQFTNNLHVYVNRDTQTQQDVEPAMLWSGKWEPQKLIDEPLREYPTGGRIPLFVDVEEFKTDLDSLFNRGMILRPVGRFQTPFFEGIVKPMLIVWNLYKQKEYVKAGNYTEHILQDDWRVAASEWIQRAYMRSEKRRVGVV